MNLSIWYGIQTFLTYLNDDTMSSTSQPYPRTGI